MLFGYEPPLPAGPYREIGAVFAHASPCAGPRGDEPYPADWYRREQVLRAYDGRGWIVSSSLRHDGSDPAAAIAQVLADLRVVQVHSRNVVHGCYMFTISRP